MRILELFSGTASFSKVARERGHDCRTLDNDPRFEPTYPTDIMDFEPSVLDGFKPDIIWASPPCQCFSVMVISKNWENKRFHAPKPKRPQTIIAMDIAKKTIDIIKELHPKYYFIENPRAMLRKMPFMKGWHKSTVTYCQYGLEYQKATDIWNNCYHWRPRPVCSARSPCHVRAPRGSKAGLQAVGQFKQFPNRNGKNPLHPGDVATHRATLHPTEMSYVGKQRNSMHPKDMKQELGWDKATLRAIVPRQLCEEIIIACEAKI